ncbi:MAG: hypothetical protein BWY65_02435 [Firmicutes bacterium ADurb.Bin373]|nr:MAG: hypothetical protein BWY65_02435 [Firmicutes bacterium ADurb.Bin373]
MSVYKKIDTAHHNRLNGQFGERCPPLLIPAKVTVPVAGGESRVSPVIIRRVPLTPGENWWDKGPVSLSLGTAGLDIHVIMVLKRYGKGKSDEAF